MRMLVSVEFADAGTKTGTHRVLVVGGCSDATAPGDIGISLEEAKALLNALQWDTLRRRRRKSLRGPVDASGVALAYRLKTGRGAVSTPFSVAYSCKRRA